MNLQPAFRTIEQSTKRTPETGSCEEPISGILSLKPNPGPIPRKGKNRRHQIPHPRTHMGKKMSIFDEQYRVVAIDGDRLVIKGILSGNVLTIVNPEPQAPLTQQDYPLGKLIALTDPSVTPLN
ncbi:MAG: hypothetical protein LAO30_10635 [Acidobacteriia bacterium]|nr:hypothetical protein [Terriglobia bacterium]